MIVSRTHDGLTETFDGELGNAVWRCLGRRGMLFSECESFDYVRLAPGSALDERGRGDIEEAWFVLRGRGEFLADGEAPLRLREGELVLCSHGTAGRWRATEDSPLELLVLALMPASVSRRLPTRTPAD
ncbi:Cupin domain-containing protein [Saccharopolyspora kobensis]|uniref:Cupin domain-containing protein n=1 Tax=Saccharopolyspora kobensis TaxID=146035 RepID=A0A1H5VE49_9PSEU|nr:cupin domain-containing protein [Saccharopolyspora kobensis]SEF85480.1 Cupin domain-containing protein [Saccharopolyspora kobensis]SFC61846.1 Cupin domain-containing protein [Saccharopolyspora kobensis]